MFQPMGNRILVDLDEVTATESGLYIPQTASAGPKRGVVVSVGPHYFVGPTKVECPFKAGDRVMVDELGGQKIKVDGKEVLMVRNEDVIGIFKTDPLEEALKKKDWPKPEQETVEGMNS